MTLPHVFSVATVVMMCIIPGCSGGEGIASLPLVPQVMIQRLDVGRDGSGEFKNIYLFQIE